MATQPGNSTVEPPSSGAASDNSQNPLEAIHAVALSDIGLRREENQDSLGTVENDVFRLFMVADGMGGVKGGATASGLAIEVLKDSFRKASSIDEKSLVAAIQKANTRIFEEALTKPALTGMGTTFVGLAFIGTDLLVSSVGDSRAYRIRDGQVHQLTEDHTLVMELLRSGTISPEQAHNHPVSHMLTRSLGPAPEVEADCFLTEKPHPGDVYLLCSDGLYNLVGETEIGEILTTQELEAGASTLVDLANERGGTDNITVICIEVKENYPVSIDVDNSNDKGQHETFIPKASREEALVLARNASAPRTPPSQVTTPVESAPVESAPPSAPPEEAKAPEQSAAPKVEPPQAAPAVPPPVEQALPNPEELEAQADVNYAASSRAQRSERLVRLSPAQELGRAQSTPGNVVTVVSSAWNIYVVIALALVIGLAIGQFIWGRHGETGTHTIAAVAPEHQAEREAPAPAAIASQEEPQETPAPKDPLFVDTRSETHLVEPHTFPGDEPSTAGLTQEQISRIRARQQNLQLKIQNLGMKIDSFDKPFSGDVGKIIADAEVRIQQYETELEEVKKKVDVGTRRLAIWYQRRKQLKDTDPINLAQQVALSSESVRQKNEAFKEATANYIREAEILLLNPADQKQSQRVSELATVRKQRISQLANEIRVAIDNEIADADQYVAELALERDRVDLSLQNARRDRDYTKVLMSTDANAKSKIRDDLRRERDSAQAELDSLIQLLPAATPSSARKPGEFQVDPNAAG